MTDLAWGLQISALGMGLVFGLLALLWGLLSLVQRLDRPAPAPTPAASEEPGTALQARSAEAAPQADRPPGEAPAGAAPTPALVQGMDAELVAAIMVATLRHRAVLRREAAPAMRSYWPGSMLYASRWVGAGRSRQNRSWQRRS